MAATIKIVDSDGTVLLPVRWMSQTTEPILTNVKDTCIWVNTVSSPNRIFFIYKRATLDQVKVELTSSGDIFDVIVIVTASYTILAGDDVIIANNISPITLTLPVASASSKTYKLKNINTGLTTIACNGSDTIDGAATQFLYQWDSINVQDYLANKWITITNLPTQAQVVGATHNESLLVSQQLSNSSGIFSASVLTMLANPSAGDLIILKCGKAAGSGLYTLDTALVTGAGPESIVISPDGLNAYATYSGVAAVAQYSRNAFTGLLTALIPATVASGNGPYIVTISPDGLNVYVTNNADATISQYSRNPATGLLTPLSPATIASGASPIGIRVSSDGLNVYVANAGANTISQYLRDPITGLLTALTPATTATGAGPYSIAISPNGLNVYTADSGANAISQYSRDPITGLLTPLSPATVATGASPRYVTISPDGLSAYTANVSGASVSQFSRDPATGKLTPLSPATVAVGTNPRFLAISPDSLNVYVTNAGSATVSQFSRDPATGKLTPLSPATLATGTSPYTIAVSPDGLNAYVVNLSSNTLTQYSIASKLRRYGATTGGDVQYAVGALPTDTMINLAAVLIADVGVDGVCDAYVCTGLASIAASVLVIVARATGLVKPGILGTWVTQANCKIVDFNARDYASKTLITLPTSCTIPNFGFERTVANLLPKETHYCRNNIGTYKELYWSAESSTWIPTALKSIKTVTAAYTLLTTDDNVVGNSAIAFPVTLYLATGSGRSHKIPNINSGVVTLTRSGSDLINGATTVPIAQYETAEILDAASGVWLVTA